MKSPSTYRDAIYNINYIQNLLALVKTASLIEQISGDDYTEMTRKCILNKRIDIYFDAWSKHSKLNERTSEEDTDTSVGAALKNLSISVISLKKASLTINQVNFFISYLKVEIEQLNLLESRANPGNRQSTARGGFQNTLGGGQFKPRY